MRRRRRRRIMAWTLGAVSVVVITCVVLAGVYLYRLSTAFDDQRNIVEADLEDDTAYRTEEGVINMLVIGNDTREEDEEEYRQETGEDDERSDTIMFVHIPEDRSGIYVMSIMRDLWVDIPGHGEGRINSAVTVGGEQLVIETVEELLDTHIDHMAMIDFDGFSELTEALGGVYVDNPRAFSAGSRNPAFYPEGTIRLEGSEALRFVRERQAFPDGDYTRVQNQQLVISAVMDRFLSSEILTNPQTVMNVVDEVVPYLAVDEGLDAQTVAGYAMDMRNMGGDDIESFTIPGGEQTTTSGGADVILPDPEALDRLHDSLDQEDMAGYLEHLDDEDIAPPSDEPPDEQETEIDQVDPAPDEQTPVE